MALFEAVSKPKRQDGIAVYMINVYYISFYYIICIDTMITMHMYAHEITYIQNTLRLSQCMCYFPSYRSNQELWAILPNYRVLYRTLSRGRLPFSLHFALCKLVSDGFLSVANLRLWQWFTPRLFLLKEHPPAIIHFPKLVNQQWQWT